MVNDYKFDNYFNHNADNCFIAYDFGANFKVAINKVQFYTRINGLGTASGFSGSQIQGRNADTEAWTTLLTVDNSVHLGKNLLKDSANEFLTPYRQIRFLSNQNTLVRRSNCQVTEL